MAIAEYSSDLYTFSIRRDEIWKPSIACDQRPISEPQGQNGRPVRRSFQLTDLGLRQLFKPDLHLGQQIRPTLPEQIEKTRTWNHGIEERVHGYPEWSACALDRDVVQ